MQCTDDSVIEIVTSQFFGHKNNHFIDKTDSSSQTYDSQRPETVTGYGIFHKCPLYPQNDREARELLRILECT